MTDQLEQHLRDAFSERAALLDPAARARLRALDYRPRRHRLGAIPTLGAVGVTGVGAAVAAVILTSGAAPAFAGWEATPTTPAPGQLALAQQSCGASLGTPVLTDTRGPYTASIYEGTAGNHVCLAGNGISLESDSTGSAADLAAGQVELNGAGMQDSAGDSLTLVDGQVGSGVTAVTIDRSDGTAVQATVTGGWYLAWWPGTVSATQAEVTTASGTSDQSFPQLSTTTPPPCPAGASCSHGYAFGSGRGSSGGGGSSSTSSGSSSSSVGQTGTQTATQTGGPTGAVGNSGP